MTSVRSLRLNLEVIGVILMLDNILTRPVVTPSFGLRSPPFISGLVPVVIWPIGWNDFTGVRIDEITIGGLRSIRPDYVGRPFPFTRTPHSRVEISIFEFRTTDTLADLL